MAKPSDLLGCSVIVLKMTSGNASVLICINDATGGRYSGKIIKLLIFKLFRIHNLQNVREYEQDMPTAQTIHRYREEDILNTNCHTAAKTQISNSHTIGCPPVRGDNPRALASGLSYVQVDKHGITILYHLHQCRPCTSSDISC